MKIKPVQHLAKFTSKRGDIWHRWDCAVPPGSPLGHIYLFTRDEGITPDSELVLSDRVRSSLALDPLSDGAKLECSIWV